MDSDRLRERITDQFSYRGDRADVWRAFDLLLDTDAFLNLGYSPRYVPHLLGSSQRRLAERVGAALARHLPSTPEGVRLLDVGCGRGGPAIYLAERFGYRVAGIDLVPYNVGLARENARKRRVAAEFVVGDATRLPFAPASFAACTAVDSLVYLPDREAVFGGVADVLEPGGVAVLTDLVVRPGVSERARGVVDSFADAWDMPPLGSAETYRRSLDEGGLALTEAENLTPNSVGQFRKWTRLFLWTMTSPAGPVVERLLRRSGLDPPAILAQVRKAHRALPYLQHVLLVVERE